MRSFLVAFALAGCSGGTAATPAVAGSAADLDLGGLGGRHDTPPPVTPDAAVAVAAVPTPVTPGGVDFIEDAKLLYRVAACGGDSDVG
ncbi:MAG: hypothetical protein ABI867_41160, partial [Kofleriaceae bacterium]